MQNGGKVRPLEVKKGDKILFGKYSGQTVKVEGTEYLVIFRPRSRDAHALSDSSRFLCWSWMTCPRK